MKKIFPLYLLAAMLVSFFVSSCNDDSDSDYEVVDPSVNAVMVNTFSLQKNDSVLANLDSVYFSIDLNRAIIFNADSLPKGTKVNRLVCNMTFSSVKKAEITMPNDLGVDTVVNFLTNSSDSINFSRGFVKLHLESSNGEVQRDYTIYVNVHNVEPDMMVWTKASTSTLPTSLSSVEVQRTIEFKEKFYCFTQNGNDFCRAIAEDPGLADWEKSSVMLPAGVRLATLTSGSESLFVVDDSDILYSSSDEGATWTSTGVTMSHIYGAIGDMVVGVRHDGSVFKHVTYPASAEIEVDESCPVIGTSPAVIYTTEWSDQPMMIVAGGLTASGEYVGDCWAYDGNQWSAITLAGMPGVEAPVIVPYFAFKTDEYWKVTRQSVLLAFGGRQSFGVDSKDLYISYDFGVHWTKASSQMQLPVEYTPGAYAQAFVYNQSMTETRSVSAWHDMQLNAVPAWYAVVKPVDSRAVTPITEWDCPFIYTFGGVDYSDSVFNQVWRGVINRLEFKPLQ